MYPLSRFTSVRVTAKYHSIKLEYQERRRTVLDLLNQLKIKLRSWKRTYISQESVRVLMQDWNVCENFISDEKRNKINCQIVLTVSALLGNREQPGAGLYAGWSLS